MAVAPYQMASDWVQVRPGVWADPATAQKYAQTYVAGTAPPDVIVSNIQPYLPALAPTSVPAPTSTPWPPTEAQAAAAISRAIAAAPVSLTQFIVVGTSPQEELVIVKNPNTGELYYKPGTPEQIKFVTVELAKVARTPNAKLPVIPYRPPSGISVEKPIPGSLVKPAEEGKPVVVYDYRGLSVTLTPLQAKVLNTLVEQALADKTKLSAYVDRAVALGILQEGTKVTGIGILPGWAIAAQEKFAREHIQLADGKWMKTDDWSKLPQHLQTIGQKEGFAGLTRAFKDLNREYEEFQQSLASGEIVALADGQYIARDTLKKLPQGTQQLLMSGGFAKLEEIEKTTWYDVVTRKYLTAEERKKLIEQNPVKNDQIVLAPKSVRRQVTKGLSFIVPPAKALLPEFTARDVSAIEWGLGTVNVALIAMAFAPGALVCSVAGRATLTTLSTTGAGLIGFETGKHWNQLSPVEKGIGVGGTLLYAMPALTVVARGVKVSSVKIPTAEGEATVWKGLSLFSNPVIGKSGGKWVVSARNLTLPEAKLILDGYHPEMMLDTKVFVNPAALQKAGLSKIQTDYLTLTLKGRNLFAGTKSPFLAKEELFKPTERLDADEIQVLLRQIAKYNKDIKQVDMIYGSPTIKAQVAPELRQWRGIHDWDISTTMSLDRTNTFASETMAELQKLLGNRQYHIRGTLIEKRIGGEWKHIADIHSYKVKPSMSAKELPVSKLDATSKYSYGRQVAEPAITVEYPGIGKFDIMRLSESGVRKSDTILRVRQMPEGTAFRPPERGIASPGVPKDAADYYVILRTFKGREIADEWAEAWAKAMGYTPEEAKVMLPRITKAFEKVASETPSDLIGYRFSPSKVTPSPKASPQITIHVPGSLGASVLGSPGLARKISRPTNPYSVSPSISPKILPEPSALTGYSLMTSNPVSTKVSPVPSVSTLPSVLPNPVSGPRPSPIPSLKPSPQPSPKPSPKPKPSPEPSPEPSPTPSPTPSPAPSPEPSPEPSPTPSPTPSPAPSPEPSLSRKRGDEDVLRIEKVIGIPEKPGVIIWKSGIVEVTIEPPYREGTEDITYERLKEPQRGKGSQEGTLRVLKGEPPQKLVLRRGMVATSILAGKKMTHARIPTGPGLVLRSGKVQKQRRGSIVL